MADYEAAKGIDAPPLQAGHAPFPGTWRWLCVRYFAECAEYKRLDPGPSTYDDDPRSHL